MTSFLRQIRFNVSCRRVFVDSGLTVYAYILTQQVLLLTQRDGVVLSLSKVWAAVLYTRRALGSGW